jgi:hypothetical protein
MESSNSYNCLGIAYQFIGKRELAKRATTRTTTTTTTTTITTTRTMADQ